MKTDDFNYELPPEYIAQSPAEPRDSSRLLVMDRKSGELAHAHFYDLGRFLRPRDLLVLNETRVIPARLYGWKQPGGGRVEILLLHQHAPQIWETLVGGKGLTVGRQIQIEKGPTAKVIDTLNGPRRLVEFSEPVGPWLEEAGHVPLPPYIHESLRDPERYQTIYARQPGSAAAPTAGLHFTSRLMEELATQGIGFTQVTLHVGLDTFAPVTENDPREHTIHTEWCQLSEQAAQTINNAHLNGGRIIAVGTTSVRTLESAARCSKKNQVVSSYEGPTDLYILPGYQFKAVDAMITNFHLPRSTLIMLVSAFTGLPEIMKAYQVAKESGYRFYSFGDAIFIQ